MSKALCADCALASGDASKSDTHAQPATIASRASPGRPPLAEGPVTSLVDVQSMAYAPGTSTVYVSRPERSTVPGSSPVCSPSRTISMPFTRT